MKEPDMPVTSNQMTEFLDAMTGACKQNTNPHPIDPLAQAMELRDRRKRALAPHVRPILPGDLVREKKGLATYVHRPVMIVWEMLNPLSTAHRKRVESLQERATYSGAPEDCFIAYLHDTGETVVIQAHSTQLLEHIDFEVPSTEDKNLP